MRFLVLFSLISVALGQQLISLSSLEGGNVKNPLNVDAPYGIYVSAISDDVTLLSNIYVVQEDGTQMSLNQIKARHAFPTSGELQAYPVSKSAYLTTALGSDVLKKLNGVMFLSSTSQLKNNNFHVVDINAAINLQQLGNIPSTVLFLNTHADFFPNGCSIISQWKQDLTTKAHIYSGFPQDAIEPKTAHIFSNPMSTTTSDVFFPTVEKFSIVMAAFYLKTTNGGVHFTIEPGYHSIDGTSTSDYTTTGFYMKELGKADSTVTIKTKRDNRHTGSTGANMIGTLPDGGKVKVGEYDGDSHFEFSVTPNDFITPWTAPAIGQTFQISSLNGTAHNINGQYYVQYYVKQDDNTGTTSLPGRQTTARQGTPTKAGCVETTTKSSGTVQFFLSIMISTGLYRVF